MIKVEVNDDEKIKIYSNGVLIIEEESYINAKIRMYRVTNIFMYNTR